MGNDINSLLCAVVVKAYCLLLSDKKSETLQTIDIIAQEQENLLTASLSTILENTGGCAEQYRCASTLYLMSVMSQNYPIIIDRGISAPGHVKEVVDGLNDVDKLYIYKLMSKAQIPGSVRFDSQIKMHTGNENKDVNLAKEFKNHQEEEHC